MDNLFFWLSKLVWLFLSPDSLLFLLILTSLVLLFLDKQHIAKYLLSITSGLLIIIAFFPIGEWLLYPLESRFQANPVLPEKIDGIIVLSGAEDPFLSHLWHQVELGGAAERDFTFLALARQYPDAKLVFTGGSGSLSKQEFKAADVAKILFAQQGFDVARILFERESRNTYENVIYSYEAVKKKKNENWILVTTAWHMPRSVGLFCKTGWSVIPYPVDHSTQPGHLLRTNFNLASQLIKLNTAIKEWLGLIAYYISGKTTALLPSQCH